ncbi:unnamed protein product, partial [Ascophyllum nodosum]
AFQSFCIWLTFVQIPGSRNALQTSPPTCIYCSTSGMRWSPVTSACVLLLSECRAFLCVPLVALDTKSGSFQVAAGLRASPSRSLDSAYGVGPCTTSRRDCIRAGLRQSPSRSLDSAYRAWPYTTSRKDCLRIRGGWGGSWSRAKKTRDNGDNCRWSSPLALKPRGDDEAKIRGGALWRKAANPTNSMDTFSGTIEFQ